MAQAKAFINGTKVIVTAGPFANHVATMVDNLPIPDGGDHRSGAENQRKVLVKLDDVFGPDDQPTETYILPRLLSNNVKGGAAVDMEDYLRSTMPVAEAQAALTIIDHGTVQQGEPITDPMDPALDRFRPDVKIVESYVSRIVPGGFTDIDFLLALRDMRDDNGYSPNVALVGDTQSGKTMLVQCLAVIAAKRDGMPKPYPVFTLSGSSGVTSYDIFGQTSAVIIDGREVLVWMEGLAALAAKAGGFLYLDEWNAVPPSQAVSLHCLLDERRQFINTQKAVPDGHGGFAPEVVKANPALWTLATINPGYKGTQTMAEATSNRFRWLPWDYDEDTEKALIPSKTVRLIGGRLREAIASRLLTVPVGTSVLQRLNKDAAMFGVDAALWTFKGLFPPAERDRVDAILNEGDGALADLLREEYPDANVAFKPVDHGDSTSEDRKNLADTWSV